MSLHSHTLPSRNAESRTQTLDKVKGSLLQEKEEEEKEATDVVDDVRKWLWEVGVTEEGVYHRAINTRTGNGRNNEAVSLQGLHPTWTKCCRMTIPSYTVQLWTPCVYTQQRLIPASESAIHKNNKALRLKSTKRWDSLNKSYCWQQANPTVCMHVCMHVKRLLDTFPKWEKVLAESVHIFVWNIYTSHHSRVKAHVLLVSYYLSCVSVCLSLLVYLCVRKRVCVWVHTEWFMVVAEAVPKSAKVEKDSQALCAFKGFLFL